MRPYGGVLYGEDAGSFDAFGARHGLGPGVLWAAYHDIPEHRASRTGRLDNAGYLAGVVRALAAGVGPERARRIVEEFQRERARTGPIDPAFEALLDRLRGRVRLGLLSNAGRGGRARLEANGVAALFDDVLCSAEVGLAKPAPEVFRLAARRLGAPCEACAFVDDMARNVEGARAVGMRAFHYARDRHEALLRFLADLGVLGP